MENSHQILALFATNYNYEIFEGTLQSLQGPWKG
jgi:hypothetical protein